MPATTTLSPNMNLPVPVVGVDPGPDWATQINNCLALIDSHTHVAGQGVAITPSGLDINADLSFAGNNMTLVRSTRFQNQATTLSGVSDLNCVYSSGTGGDLYYNDGSGNKIRITQSGAVAGTPGSISNLVSPASATYVPASQSFVWQSAANTAANLDCGSVILRNITASSYGLTLSPPSSLGLNYTITLPAIPAASGNFLTIDTSGNISSNVKIDGVTLLNTSNTIAVQASQLVDNSTTAASSNLIIVKSGGINTTQLADASVTTAKLDSTLQAIVPKAWVVFNAAVLAGTYTKTTNTVTVTMAGHGMSVGDKFYIQITTGTAGGGAKTVLTATSTTFTYNDSIGSGSTSGNCSRYVWIRKSYNILAVSLVTASTVGYYNIFFIDPVASENYSFYGSAYKVLTPTFCTEIDRSQTGSDIKVYQYNTLTQIGADLVNCMWSGG
jgi:hypothetical protein